MKKIALLLIGFVIFESNAQKNITNANDNNAPLHALQPDYPTPYKVATKETILANVDKIFTYLEQATPTHMIDATSGQKWEPGQPYSDQIKFSKGDFRPISYEWGVTYSGMLALNQITGQERFKKYVFDRLSFIEKALPAAKEFSLQHPDKQHALRGLVYPKALDDIGAMSMGVLKAQKAGFTGDLSYVVQRAEDFILKEEHRLPDHTLVRIRPLQHTMWLDDLYMAIPALMQMGNKTGNTKYYEEAIFQYESYKKRMFNPNLNIFMHGYLEGADTHPEFHWGRANGWAILTLCEMLEYLPANHPKRPELLLQFKRHLSGLMALQDGTGFWHQLLDKSDSYLETSATAIYSYVMAKGINKGWLDVRIYAPSALLAYQAVQTRISENGHVEGTCVGTGLAWDPAFYYHRPVSPFAAHGYGPVLLASAAIMELVEKHPFAINDSAIHLKEK
ncbi:glycoside hydrolase family 88 protein [Sandaracinomonas limnophila]|uniref:Glycoside hydrolase family 88 protein n=1 Tax=Sandaracinomonas limnophila TaxID=1862386 RepID=A0A437PRC0_9BACT|nr:glycoside hydrolase family 88 protein [Sandaracinomonas limnophila]RVU24781.1 glycoside hydrolase family 88 protein [Sandaracinomonas limnophila]